MCATTEGAGKKLTFLADAKVGGGVDPHVAKICFFSQNKKNYQNVLNVLKQKIMQKYNVIFLQGNPLKTWTFFKIFS